MTITTEKELMLTQLLADRLSNYGYDLRAWRRIQRQRQDAKRAAKAFSGRADRLHWGSAPLAHRIDWGSMRYVVGQSGNEEVTNLLRQLVNPNARWLS